ncbi:hypothetical protein KPL71_012096 [Citrus sinensis]|uniref:Uncharacterized protein n=1 Tax=Citrus sinensis TaxID=2711 RepID=A0ACB8L8F7_CITSI|nr:hypothetical protein KPL71_012096 [Citrus sinensis]
MASTKLEVEKFTGENDFHLWRLKMRALLVHQRLDVALDDESSSKKLMKVTEEELSEMLDRAHSAIILSLGDGVLREIILDLEDINVKIDDEDKAMILLYSLPSSYENLVDTLMYKRQTRAMGDVKEALSSKAAIKKETRDGESLTAMGRIEKRETSKNKKKRSKSRPKNLKCFHCHKEGHFKKDCPEMKNKKNNAKEKSGDAAIASEFEESDGYDLAGVLIATDAQTKGNWVLDSGCSFHMCPNKNLFTNYETCDGGIVVIGNDSSCRVVGRGLIRLKMFDGIIRELRDFKHVPDLKRNLISLGMLDKIWCLVKLESGTLKVMKGSMVVMKGNMSNVLYVLQGSAVTWDVVVSNQNLNKTMLWHMRCMLIHSKLPMSLWAEALDTACYIVNRSPSSGINFRTPYELWSGKPADYSHLRIFGCPAYAHVKQGKLEPRAFKCVFLGYPAGVKGYKLWCTDIKPPRAIISRDVVFNEHEMFRNSATVKQTIERDSGCDKRTFFEVELPKAPAQKLIQKKGLRMRLEEIFLNKKKNQKVMITSKIISCKDSKKWIAAMDEEMRSLIKNHIWDLIPTPAKKKVVGCKWIYKIKEGIPGVEPLRFKARLVAKGFTQKEEIDFNEVFSPVVRHSSLRILLALVAVNDMHLEQMDVKIAFLHGELEEMIVMAQPIGYENPDKADYVCLLKKSLYGLKQSPRQWYLRFDKFVAENSFQRCSYDCCVYHKDFRDGKYTAAAEAFKKAIWLKGMVTELRYEQKLEVSRGVVKLLKIHTDENIADMLTKAVLGLHELSWNLQAIKLQG